MKIRCAHDEMMSVEDLLKKHHPRNFNEHGSDQIEVYAEAIKESGIRRAVTISNLSGYITRGHGLTKTAEHLKITHLPVDFQDYDNEEQEIADIVADKEIAALSRTNRKKRDSIVKELAGKNKNLMITGLSKEKLDDILGSIKKIDFSKPTIDVRKQEDFQSIDEESGELVHKEPEVRHEIKSFPIAIVLEKEFFEVWQSVKGIAKVNSDSIMLKKILEKHYMESVE